jgi:acyl transferase domain-containing protein
MTDRAVPRIGGIAVIGFACRAPGALNADQFWSNLVDGVESINHFTPQILIESGVDPAQIADPAYVPARGVLSEADCFDAPLFGFTPHEASLMDPQHRIMLECAWEALEHGGYGAPGRGARVAVYAGVALNTYLLRNIFAHQGG